MSNWSFAATWPVLLLGFALWCAAAWMFYTHQRRSGGRKAVLWLEGMRFALITLLLFTLLKPEFIRRIRRSETPEIAVLADVSGSMRTRDILRTNQVTSRLEWWNEQKERAVWKPLEQDARVIVEEFAAPSTNASAARGPEGTDLNLALEQVLQRYKNPKAVLLLTDGDWNLGSSPVGVATRYREQEIPVFSVAVGRDTPLPDLVLEAVAAPSYGLFGETISIPFRIRSHLPREVKTYVSLFSSKGEETKKEIVIPRLGEVNDVVIWSPRAVGDENLTLRAPVEADEALSENNEKQFRIAVKVETLKVLVIDSLPRWEYRFLRNALARDPGVEMHCLLFHPGLSTLGGGPNYLSAFPGTKELISRYDVIFLGDVGIGQNELTSQDAELIKGLVEQQASGLVFLPGRRGRQMTWLTTPLKELLPVVLEEGRTEGIGLQNESQLLLSSVGKGHLLTRFDLDEERNDEIWKQLPGFYWSAAVEKSRPGSEVLAVHSSLRNAWGRMPLLVTRPFGSGKVLFMGTDSAWRWRRGVEDKYHYRFWSQVVRWMAHQRHLSEKPGIRLTFSPETPQVGDTVFLQAMVLNAAGHPMEEGKLLGKIIAPSGKTERLDFALEPGGWGVFKSSFLPPEAGQFKIQLSAPEEGRELQTELPVGQPVIEKQGQPVNAEVLRELADLTRGAMGGIDSLDEMVKKISLLPEPKPLERRTRVWSSPWWGGLILLLLGIYWTGRKLAGMV